VYGEYDYGQFPDKFSVLEDVADDLETFDHYAKFDLNSFESIQEKSKLISELSMSLNECRTTLEDFKQDRSESFYDLDEQCCESTERGRLMKKYDQDL